MIERLWAHRAPPESSAAVVWQGQPATAAELSAQRAQLRTAMTDRPPAGSDDDLERLLLVFEELGSNGLRHGWPPVLVSVTSTGTGWILDVSDAATGHMPIPAQGRDPAQGGLGLYLVARICAAHGWDIRDGRKHVWGCIDWAVPSTAPKQPGSRRHQP